MATAFTPGRTVVNTKVNEKIIIWMVKVFIDGRMVDPMKVNIVMIRSMVMECYNIIDIYCFFLDIGGLMVGCMMENGVKENSMGRVNLIYFFNGKI